MDSAIQLVILQDPTEAKHKLSTAPLLARSISHAQLLVGDIFSQECICAGFNSEQIAVLYPFSHKPALAKADYSNIKRLIVLDGTWRKVRKMLLNNPWLHDLQHMALNFTNASQYRIRSSPRADGLSTIEAALFALNELENTDRFSAGLTVLEALVRQQEQFGHKQEVHGIE